jgi:putative FmdB family regulatory protein
MATYEFVCKDCGKEYEVYVKGFIEDDDKKCPDCGSESVRQKFSSFLRTLGNGGCTPSGHSGFG